MFGYTDNYLRVTHPYDTKLINTIVNVRLLSLDDEGNIGSEIVG